MKLHHIGISVPNIDEAYYQLFGSVKEVTGKVYDGGQNAVLKMYNWNGAPVELIENDKPWNMYHICFEVESLVDAVRIAKDNGYVEITEPKPAPLFDGRRVVFVMGRNHDIIEFLEAN